MNENWQRVANDQILNPKMKIAEKVMQNAIENDAARHPQTNRAIFRGEIQNPDILCCVRKK